MASLKSGAGHQATVVDGARLLFEVTEALGRQRLQCRLLLGEQLQYLAFLAAMDARGRPALLPVRKPGVLILDRLELAALECGGLGMLDRRLDRTLAIGIRHARNVGHGTIVREHRGIHRVEGRLVQIRTDHALLQIVEHDVLH